MSWEKPCYEGTFCAASAAWAFIGVELSSGPAPAGLEIKELTGGRYVKFTHKGTVKALLSTYQYIWGVWYPKSGYKLDDKEDFERYTENFLVPFHENSEIEIYFPIL